MTSKQLLVNNGRRAWLTRVESRGEPEEERADRSFSYPMAECAVQKTASPPERWIVPADKADLRTLATKWRYLQISL